MAKFRKKPVVIEAVHYDGTEEGYAAVCSFAPGVHFDPCDHGRFSVPAFGGDFTAYPGEWIVRGTDGGLYPLKSDTFEAMYDPVEEEVEMTNDCNNCFYRASMCTLPDGIKTESICFHCWHRTSVSETIAGTRTDSICCHCGLTRTELVPPTDNRSWTWEPAKHGSYMPKITVRF